MEYRKLISFGKSSFVVSLPKSWVTQNKLRKGDHIYIDESGPSLVLNKKDDERTNEEKTGAINVDGKPLSTVQREVNAAYIQNCRKITLHGREIKSKVKEFQSIIQNLIALEIMEQTTDVIVAKDFLNMEKVSIDELLRKMDVVTRTMLKETCRIFVEDNYESINERDRDVNRLYFLLYRTVLFNLEFPVKALKNLNLNSMQLMLKHSAGLFIEGAADEARRTARLARKIKGSHLNKKPIESTLKDIDKYYEDTLKCFYQNDAKSALELSEMKKKLNQELDGLETKYPSIEAGVMVSRMRRLISHIHNLGRLTYTLK